MNFVFFCFFLDSANVQAWWKNMLITVAFLSRLQSVDVKAGTIRRNRPAKSKSGRDQQKKWIFKGRISTELMEIENLEDGASKSLVVWVILFVRLLLNASNKLSYVSSCLSYIGNMTPPSLLLYFTTSNQRRNTHSHAFWQYQRLCSLGYIRVVKTMLLFDENAMWSICRNCTFSVLRKKSR